MTYSIVARDPATGHLGIAVASRFFAVGALVPHLRGGRCAVATQAYVSPLWGIDAARRIAAGEPGADVVADLLASDDGSAQRQLHLVDGSGQVVAHTGADCVDWAGHVAGDGVSVAGNMLAGPQVVAEALAAYRAHPGMGLAERLMTALEAGEAAGGDKRGRQSAALCIHRTEDYPWIDIRADDHPDPLAELRRLWEVAHERYLHMAEVLPTRARPTGVPDRSGVDAAIRAAEEQRAAEGRPSRSLATPLPG